MAVGWYILRAGTVALMRGRKGELKGGRRRGDIYVYVYTAGKNERDGRIERDVRAGSSFFLATFHNNNIS